MANTIDQAFIKQFETEVHMAYQRMGSKLRNTVRTVGNVAGNVVRFQKIGTGSASTKSRNGMVTPMELAHTNVEATMNDFYAAEYIDKLDELKTNIHILIGSFYSEDSAIFLKNRIIKEIVDFDKKKLKIKKKRSREIEVISGPYKSVNLLKNDYIKLKNIGFEEMDIFINE